MDAIKEYEQWYTQLDHDSTSSTQFCLEHLQKYVANQPVGDVWLFYKSTEDECVLSVIEIARRLVHDEAAPLPYRVSSASLLMALSKWHMLACLEPDVIRDLMQSAVNDEQTYVELLKLIEGVLAYRELWESERQVIRSSLRGISRRVSLPLPTALRTASSCAESAAFLKRALKEKWGRWPLE